MPSGQESSARAFYEDLLGIRWVPKPDHLAQRGGCWFEDDDGVKVHLGVDQDFRPATKAHPALVVDGLGDLTNKLVAAGVVVTTDEPLDGFTHVYVEDPFGNRLELMEPVN